MTVFQQHKLNENQYQLMAHFGGLCNNLMNQPVLPSIVVLFTKQIGHIPYHFIDELTHVLSPPFLVRDKSTYENLFNALMYQYECKYNQKLYNTKLEQISIQILMKASKLNQQFATRLKGILNSSEFLDVVRRRLEKNKDAQSWSENKERNGAKTIEIRSDSPGALGKTKSSFNFEPLKQTQKLEYMNLNRITENKISQTCKNLLNRPQCLCVNQRQIVTKDEFSFQCIHCNRLFHTVCMKKKFNSQFCIYCHIERMLPLKRVVRTVYLGLFRKNIRKHYATMFVPPIESNQKLQVRSLRLKQGGPTSCLFPDITQISMNSHLVREFEPINRQSCLKYRKDQPFTLLKGDYYLSQQNTLLLSESIPTVRQKDIRYEPENHLFGIFVTQDIKIDKLIEEIKEENTLGFTQSANILSESFDKFGKGDDDITCQLVKIPLTCPLSTIRIDIPVRGIFCTHFACFDLKNYLTLISESMNPRWNCPVCKNLAYELQVDSILLQILKSIKSQQKIQQILFFKNGDYTAIIDDEPDHDRKNIRNLNIPERKIRILPPPIVEQKPRKIFIVPANADIIDLDD